MRGITSIFFTGLILCLGSVQTIWANTSAEKLFTEEIQPLLEAKCTACHGPKQQMGNLRLDKKSFALKGGFGGPAWETEKPNESLLIHKLEGTAEGERMPMGMDPLSPEQIDLFRQWISQGAVWPGEDEGADEPLSTHWAFMPRGEETPPDVENEDWVSNPIDRFVLKKLEEKNIEPSPQASKEMLIRRLSLDLLGLNPTPEQIEKFKNDNEPGAYERLVDDLLASPHFGERWGRHWLDLARYADSDGYEKDLPRPYAWRYRDWVINAINDDMPYDQFTIEQLAGDLLPNPTIEQLTATGFHRNTLTNREGGVDKEEFRVKAVKDRASTTGQVWLGLTVACAECHNHKYDPISQKEFYGLYAFFNQAEKKNVKAPFPDELARYKKAKKPYDAVHDKLVDAFDAFKEKQFPKRVDDWLKDAKAPEAEWERLQPMTLASEVEDVTFAVLDDASVLVGGDEPFYDKYTLQFKTKMKGITGVQIETLPHESLPKGGSGRSNAGDFVLTELSLKADGELVALHNATAHYARDGWPADAVLDGSPATGWGNEGRVGEENRMVVQTKEPLGDGDEIKLTLTLEHDYGTIHSLGRFRVFVTNYEGEVEAVEMPNAVADALRKPDKDRTATDKQRLAQYYAQKDSLYQELKQAVDAHARTEPDFPNTYVRALVQNENPPQTRLMERGDFLRPGEPVEPQTLAVLPEMEVQKQPDRLDLARWLMDEKNPLPSRVAANRIWQYLFGEGLVRTPEDFGTRGEKPTHPKLLDWLANQYIELGWSRKAFIKLIVTSSTYKQSSATRTELLDFDAKNTLLAKQNRYRLSAEIIRDIALQTGGLLNKTIGGPSIRPPLPSDIADLGYANSVKWNVSEGDKKYRRGMYIFFQRTVPYPMLMTFDCPDSNTSVVRRNRSNTPLQALTLLNDRVFFECAQNLAYRVLSEVEGGTRERIRHAVELCLAREPRPEELRLYGQLFNQFFQLNAKNPQQARQMLLSGGSENASNAEKATWVALARTIMNLEEFITRQ